MKKYLFYLVLISSPLFAQQPKKINSVIAKTYENYDPKITKYLMLAVASELAHRMISIRYRGYPLSICIKSSFKSLTNMHTILDTLVTAAALYAGSLIIKDSIKEELNEKLNEKLETMHSTIIKLYEAQSEELLYIQRLYNTSLE